MVRFRVCNRDKVGLRVSVRIPNIGIVCHDVANVVIIYTAALCLSVA